VSQLRECLLDRDAILLTIIVRDDVLVFLVVVHQHRIAGKLALANSLDAEEMRAVQEGLSPDELALFDLLFRDSISGADRERLKQASKSLLASLRRLLEPIHDWTQNTTTQADVKMFILDDLWRSLPRPPFTDEDTEELAARVYDYVWQRSASGYDRIVA
jgi:type I restriction enzyme R subunit